MEKPFANAIRVALILALLAPLVVMSEPLPSLFFPYIVGKALYTRLLIEVALVLWLALAFWYPSYRPPRSWLLAAFAVYVLIALLASLTGVSAQRSIWSTYERMQGWIDLAHWLAFAVVAVSVFRSFRDWRTILNINLAVGLVLGLLGLAEMNDLNLLSYLEKTGRLNITFGNPTFVGAYMLVNALMAAAFLAHSLSTPKPSVPERSRRAERARRRTQARSSPQPPISLVTLMRVFWVVVIALDLVMVYQSGTRGAVLGLAAALALFLVAYALWGKLRRVRIAAIALAVFLVLLVALVPAFLAVRDTETFRNLVGSNTTLSRLASIGPDDSSVRSRINSATVGFNGFTERPLLGWGPDNYTAAYDRHLTARAVAYSTESFDQAHNKVIEELVTKGLLGLAGYLAIWLVLAWILIRRIRDLRPDAQLFTMLIGAALAGYFIQNLALFDTPGTAVQLYLLLGFALYLETTPTESAFDPAYVREAVPGKLDRFEFLKSKPARRMALAASGVIGLALIYFMVAGPYAGAQFTFLALGEDHTAAERIDRFEDAINAAPGLANYPRRFMITELGNGWGSMSGEDRLAALEVAKREGEAALEVEPMEWRIHEGLVKIYHLAAYADPGYAEQARLHTDEALKIAPERIEVQQLLVWQSFVEGDQNTAINIIDDYLERNAEVLEGSSVLGTLTDLRGRVGSASLSPIPTTIAIGETRSFTLSTTVTDDPGVWVGVNYDGEDNLTRHGCPGVRNDGGRRVDGAEIAITGCKPGTARVRLFRNGTPMMLAEYSVKVTGSVSLSPIPTSIAVGETRTFRLSTTVPDDPGVWVGVNYDGEDNLARGGEDNLTRGGCTGRGNDGRAHGDGAEIVITGCKPGTARVRLFRDGTGIMLAEYSVKVTGLVSLSPIPTSIAVGETQTFTLSTILPDDPGVWVGVNYDGEDNLTRGGCPGVGDDGRAHGDGAEVAITGCKPGTARVRLFRNGSPIMLAEYSVKVFTGPASLLPIPTSIALGETRSFTLLTTVPDDPGVWVGVNYDGEDNLARGGCPGVRNDGGRIADGAEVAITGCKPGTARVRLFRSGSSIMLAEYSVKVIESSSLSPIPTSIAVGETRSFTLSTTLPGDPGVWVGVNYDGEDNLARGGCPGRANDGRPHVDGAEVAITGCKPGTARVRLFRHRSHIMLAEYSVTVE